MQIFLLILSLLVAIALLILLIVVLGSWMTGGCAVVFPGLGLLIATPLFFILLLVAEIVVVLLVAYLAADLVRDISVARLMTDEMDAF
jgi:small-conductance mechanosensitive channel